MKAGTRNQHLATAETPHRPKNAKMKRSLLIAVLFAACAAQTQTLRVVPVHLEGTGQTTMSVQFFCTQDYNRDECLQHALDLRRALMIYPLERLGMWSFALVPSYKWKGLVRALGGPTNSPAFTIFEQRTTVMRVASFPQLQPVVPNSCTSLV
jgi:hypothetical protein